MPAGTGDIVMYLQNAATAPSSGNPSNGAILYANSGQLRVRQQDGNDFSIGSIPNPSVWGPSTSQTYTSRNYIFSTSSTPSLAFNYTIPDPSSIRVDVIMVGQKVGTTDTAQYNLSLGYVREGGAPVAVGTLTSADPRYNGDGSGWTAPTITLSGNNINVYTGALLSATIHWTVITQLTITT